MVKPEKAEGKENRTAPCFPVITCVLVLLPISPIKDAAESHCGHTQKLDQ